MNRTIRLTLIIAGVVSLIFAIGFFLQLKWATQFWPVDSGRLSYLFVSSILAAIGMPILWIGLSRETRAMAGGAINIAITSCGLTIYAFLLYIRDQELTLLLFAAAALCLFLLTIVLFAWSSRQVFIDTRPIPQPVKLSFAVFSVVLLLVGSALVVQRPNIFPWSTGPENSVFYGWIFLGAMCYFLYTLLYPVWGNTYGQLIGFLAYDMILIVPFLQHFSAVRPEMRLSLTIYTLVISYSALLAIYYLFLNPNTRFIFRHLPGDYQVSS
jgi:hypothetical protein